MSNISLFAAVFPGLWLFYKIYKLDKIEKEPMNLIVRLFIFGALCVAGAMVLEMIGIEILNVLVLKIEGSYLTYMLLENFLVIALAEEGLKYLTLKTTWKNPDFNYRFDAVVYAVSVTLGFAIVENILYVSESGFSTAVIRAVCAIPLHTICGIFMGHYYGEARLASMQGSHEMEKRLKRKALIIPVLIHGFYDFSAGTAGLLGLVWLIFVIGLEIYSIRKVKEFAAQDRPV